MNELSQIESKLIVVRQQKVLLDRDVAELYGIETKRVNEAYRNNPDKFPEGYVLFLDEEESHSLRSKFSTLKNLILLHPKTTHIPREISPDYCDMLRLRVSSQSHKRKQHRDLVVLFDCEQVPTWTQFYSVHSFISGISNA
jgi:hypothetical protein